MFRGLEAFQQRCWRSDSARLKWFPRQGRSNLKSHWCLLLQGLGMGEAWDLIAHFSNKARFRVFGLP